MSKKTEARKLLNQLRGISYIALILKELENQDSDGTQCPDYQRNRKLLKLMYKNAQRGYGIIIKERHLPLTKMRKAIIFGLNRNIKHQIYDSLRVSIGMNSAASFMYDFPNP